jgi:hypothetical protein
MQNSSMFMNVLMVQLHYACTLCDLSCAALLPSTSGECSEACKMRRREQENELKQAVRELKIREEQYRHMEHEAQALRQYKDSQNDTEVLMSALAAMQDKNSHLENSLSSETRVKLDLFSALGEAKRQIEIQTST